MGEQRRRAGTASRSSDLLSLGSFVLLGLPDGMTEQDAISGAREAIRAGTNPNLVRWQLRQWGIDPAAAGL